MTYFRRHSAAELAEIERRYHELYHPPRFGVHVCGADEHDQAKTFAHWRTAGPRAARAMFDRLRSEFAKADDEPTELVVDLCLDWDISEDFSITRQMLEPLRRAAEALSE